MDCQCAPDKDILGSTLRFEKLNKYVIMAGGNAGFGTTAPKYSTKRLPHQNYGLSAASAILGAGRPAVGSWTVSMTVQK